MTAEQLHDALTLLPEDLLIQAESCRGRKKRPVPLLRYMGFAACFALVLAASLFSVRLVQPKGATESAAQMEAAELLDEVPEEPAAKEPVPEENAQLTQGTAAEESDRTHQDFFAAAPLRLSVTDTHTGQTRSLEPSDGETLSRLLTGLTWDPRAVCNCLAEYRVEGLDEETYELNLTEGFARTARGQALLTEDQVQAIRTILEKTEVTP